MAFLQIRPRPDDVSLVLTFRAEQAYRSFEHQTVIELRRSIDSSSSQRRRAVLQKIRNAVGAQAPAGKLVQPAQATQWIREDRERE